MYKSWASTLSNDNILDVARSIETVISSEPARQQLLNYRDHLRREGIFEISEEEMRRQTAERNRQRALAKRQQLEQQKLEALKAAQKQKDGSDKEGASEYENDGADEDLDANDSGIVSDSSI
jgi:protein subunit release factor B